MDLLWIVLIVVVCALLLVVVAYLDTKPLGPNPLTAPRDAAFEPGQDDVTRTFSMRRVPANLDAIIIGSGVAGLTTAALLSLAGRRVLVVEQHDRAGGMTHSFEENGFEFDTGIHYLGRMIRGNMDYHLMDIVSEGRLKFDRMDHHFDSVRMQHPHVHFDIPGNRYDFQKALIERYPEEGDAIRRFVKDCVEFSALWQVYYGQRVMKLAGSVLYRLYALYLQFRYANYFWKQNKSTLEELEERFKNRELVGLLCYIVGNVGVAPSRLTYVLYASLVGHYIRNGGFYPHGGSGAVARSIIPTIRKRGGEVLVRAGVSQILVERGRAVGVEIRGKDRVMAAVVVSTAGVLNTYFDLLEPHPLIQPVVSHLREAMEKNTISPTGSHFVVYVGLNKSSEELGLPARNIWVYENGDAEEEYGQVLDKNAPYKDPTHFFISFPSAKDRTYSERHPGHAVADILSLCKYDWVKEHENEPVRRRGPDYQDLKDRVAEASLQALYRYCPQIKPGDVEHVSVGTALTWRHYLSTSQGTSFGLHHTPERYREAVSGNFGTPIKKLYVAGHETTSAGFVSAADSAILLCMALLRRDLPAEVQQIAVNHRH